MVLRSGDDQRLRSGRPPESESAEETGQRRSFYGKAQPRNRCGAVTLLCRRQKPKAELGPILQAKTHPSITSPRTTEARTSPPSVSTTRSASAPGSRIPFRLAATAAAGFLV